MDNLVNSNGRSKRSCDYNMQNIFYIYTSKKMLYLIISLVFLCIFVVSVQATDYDLSRGEVSLHYMQHNPIEIGVRDGRQGIAATQLNTERYLNQTEVGSTDSNFNFSLNSLAELFELNANVKDGGLNSSTYWQNGASSLSAQGKDMTISYSVDKRSEGEAGSKQIEVLILANAKEGILSVNTSEDTFRRPSDTETISRKMGITRLEARDLLNTNGRTRVFEALKRANGTNNFNNGNGNLRNTGEGEVAGGAGAIAGSGGIWLNSLDPQSTFSFYLHGPNFQAKIQDSILNMKFLYPGNGTEVKGLGATITLAGPINGDSETRKRVVLLDNLSYDESEGIYSYPFEQGWWLLNKEEIKPGGYDLFIDLGPSLTAKFGVTITKNHEVVEGRY